MPENTVLLCKGEYHCTTGLQFDWFGFSWFAYFRQILTYFLFGRIQSSQTGDQPYSDTSLYEVS